MNGKNRKKFLLSKISKEDLIEYYVGMELSANYIAIKIYPELKIYASTIIALLEHFDIPRRNMSETSKLDSVRNMYKETCKEKYGVENPSSSEEIKERRTQTVKKRYGVENVFQNEEIKKKSAESMIAKYGVTSPIHTDEYWSKQKKSYYMSKPHKKANIILTEAGICVINEEHSKFKKYNEVLGREFSPRPDMIIESKKVVIEINGDYFHANPKKYDKNDIISTWKGKLKAKDVWARDLIKKNHIEDQGYTVLLLWEDDINDPEYMKAFIGKLIDMEDYE